MVPPIDQSGEWLRLLHHYRRMTDGELIQIAGERNQLTEIAQQILAMEVAARRLKLEKVNPGSTKRTRTVASPPRGSSEQSTQAVRTQRQDQSSDEPADDPFAEDRKLVHLLTVWSLRDALRVQHLLDLASIPFYMGAENATGVDAVTSSFTPGVGVKVMRIGVPWARQALERYEPKDEPESERESWDERVDVRCAQCRAQDIVFEEQIPSSDGSAHKYKWTCSVCGHQWEDDGVARL